MAKYSFYISDGVFISPESRFEEALKTGSDVCHEDSVVWTFGSPVPMPPEALIKKTSNQLCNIFEGIRIAQINDFVMDLSGWAVKNYDTSRMFLNSDVRNVALPCGIKYLDGMFENCHFLTSVTLPESVLSARNCFLNCDSLVKTPNFSNTCIL